MYVFPTPTRGGVCLKNLDTNTMDGYVDDANRARGTVPEGAKAEKQGEQAGLEGGKFEEAVCIIPFSIPCFPFIIQPQLT